MKQTRLGTRGSKLALKQADMVTAALAAVFPGSDVSRTVITTKGDQILDIALSKIGDKGLFTKAVDEALLSGEIDVGVHSLKDLPSEIEKGLCIGAVLEREDPRDVLIAASGCGFSGLPRNAKLGTSSLRRTAQIKAKRPDIEVVPIRGNVETRIGKIETLGLDGIVLACAGVKRLGLERMITDRISPEMILPAVGQGVIGVVCREDDTETRDMLEKIHHPQTGCATVAERSFLHTVEGGCQVPVGCLAQVQGERITVSGLIASLDGTRVCADSLEGGIDAAEALGKGLGLKLLQAGGDEIIRKLRAE